ncbi:MAG: heme exporter protein CcmB [Robiginitomaculum sp.]
MALIKYELRLALKGGGAWLHGVLFFFLFSTLCAIALGGHKSVLAPIAPALIWLAVIFALLLAFESLFQEDASDGTLEQLSLSGLPMIAAAGAKLISHWILTVLPLLLFIPAIGYGFGLSGIKIAGLFNAVLIGSPALIIYGSFASACLIGYRSAGLLIILLTVPLIVPTLIFGLSAVDSFGASGIMGAPFKALAGISLVSIGLGLPAISAALNTYLETS